LFKQIRDDKTRSKQNKKKTKKQTRIRAQQNGQTKK